MVMILLLFGIVQGTTIWQLSSDANPARFSSSSVIPSRIANINCIDNALDYTVSMWTWHDRTFSQKQFFWSLGTTGSLKLFKTPDNLVRAEISNHNQTQIVSIAGLPPKHWELVTVSVSGSKKTVSVCVASVKTPTNCTQSVLTFSPPSLSSLTSFVNLGAPTMELLDAKVTMREWTLDDISQQFYTRHEPSVPYIACKNWECVPANQEQQACLESTQRVMSGSLTLNQFDFYDFAVSNLSYRAYLQLNVHSGDADLVAQIAYRKASWTSKRPGSDYLTLNLYSSFYKIGDVINVLVTGYSDIPTTYTLTIVEITHKGNSLVAVSGWMGKDNSMNEESQIDIETKDALLGPKDMKNSNLAYPLLIAIFVLVGLGFLVCNTKVEKRRPRYPSDGFVRLDA